MSCSICKSEKKLIHHHLSYEPEIIVIVCFRCHDLMHKLSKLKVEEQSFIIDWIKQYGKQWVNGREKFNKSEYWKNRKKTDEYKKSQKTEEAMERARIRFRKYRKTDKHKNYMKEYRGTDKYRNKSRERTLARKIAKNTDRKNES